jgi:hypothetical protein
MKSADGSQTFYTWTIRFNGGHYSVDAPSAADAMTMYQVNVVDNPSVTTFLHKSESGRRIEDARCREAGCFHSYHRRDCHRLSPPRSITVAFPNEIPPERGLWIDGKAIPSID